MKTILKDKGFKTEATGGNCTAYIKYISNSEYYLATAEFGLEVPKKHPVLIGYYKDNDFIYSVTVYNDKQLKGVLNEL